MLIVKRINGKLNARLFDLGKYPGAKPTSVKSKNVIKKIYVMDKDHFNHVLVALDDYEGYEPFNKEASLFIRKIAPIISNEGSNLTAWVYWCNKSVNGKKEIVKGDYKKYLSEIS